MIIPRFFRAAALLLLIGVVLIAAQVKTEVPDVEPGAKPVTVEHIKVTGLPWSET